MVSIIIFSFSVGGLHSLCWNTCCPLAQALRWFIAYLLVSAYCLWMVQIALTIGLANLWSSCGEDFALLLVAQKREIMRNRESLPDHEWRFSTDIEGLHSINATVNETVRVECRSNCKLAPIRLLLNLYARRFTRVKRNKTSTRTRIFSYWSTLTDHPYIFTVGVCIILRIALQ